jgi:hypothetical protein
VPPLDPDVGAQPSRSWSDLGLPQHPQFGLGRDPSSFPLGVRRQLFPARHQGPVLGDVHGDGAVQRLDLRSPFRGGGWVPRSGDLGYPGLPHVSPVIPIADGQTVDLEPLDPGYMSRVLIVPPEFVVLPLGRIVRKQLVFGLSVVVTQLDLAAFDLEDDVLFSGRVPLFAQLFPRRSRETGRGQGLARLDEHVEQGLKRS